MARSQPTRQREGAKPKDSSKPKSETTATVQADSASGRPGGKARKSVESKASAKKASPKTKQTKEGLKPGSSREAEDELTHAIVSSASQVAKEVGARAVIVYVDAVTDPERVAKLLGKKLDLIFVARDEKDLERAKRTTDKVLTVPPVNLTRMGQIKMATLMAFSQRMLAPGETFVSLVGVMGAGVDSMVVMSVGEEQEMFRTVDQPKITEHIRRAVFQRCLNLAIELAGEGREGKPVGALFVIGDQDEVAKYCHQTIINPFRGYPEEDRNILDERMRETVKEFCSIDGAFIISGKGVIISAGTTLRTAVSEEELPQGLGARHAAAAAITANTKSIAISLSESTGTVRVWRLGEMITEIEKASPAPARTSGSTAAKTVETE